MLDERTTNEKRLIGTTIQGRYRLGGVLAEGALCTVYTGEDLVLRRPIAVKVVPPAHYAAYHAALAATATLAHPAAVIVLDVFEEYGLLFLVQERVEGKPLGEMLAHGFSAERAVGLGLQLAGLLAYAHGRGLVHGDLTPTAIVVEEENIARVNNFGLPPDTAYFKQRSGVAARLMRGLSLPGAALAASGRDTPQVLKSPEGDVYALGLLLWQALAAVPARGKARDFRADVPAAVRDIVARILVPSHPQPLTTALDLLPVFEAAALALDAGRDEELQPTPPLLRHLRDLDRAAEQANPWSEQETIVNPVNQPSWSQPLVLGAGAGADAIDLSPTRPATPSVPLRNPPMSGPLAPPEVSRAPYSGPLRAPNPSGPLRAPVQSGPLRGAGARQFEGGVPSGPPRAGTTGRLGVPNLNTPMPPRGPVMTGPLRGGTSARLDDAPAYRGKATARLETTGPMPVYRPPVAVPWRDEPQVRDWARPNPRTHPLTGPNWPMALGARNLPLKPLLLMGIILFLICFVVGYFIPFVLPFH